MSDPKTLAVDAQIALNAAADALDAAFDAKGVQPRPTFGTVLRQKGTDAINTVGLALENLASLPGSTTPPPAGPIVCEGLARTKVMNVTVPPQGSPLVRYFVTKEFRDGFNGQEALVVVFKAPPAGDPLFKLGVTHTGDSNGPQCTRTFGLSKHPCDFGSTDVIVAGNATTLALNLHTLPTKFSPQAQLQLEPGATYYLNIRNGYLRDGVWTQVPAGRCDVYISVLNPA